MATAIKAAGIVLALVLGISSSAIAVGTPINCISPPDLSDPIAYTNACPGDPGFPSIVFAGGRDVSIKLPETETCYRWFRVSNARNTRIIGGTLVDNDYINTGAMTVPFYDVVYAAAQPMSTSCSDSDARHGIDGQVCDGAPPQGSFAERFMVGANYHRGNFCIGDPDTGPVPPPQAIAAGFTELAFSDEFLTADGIDINNTGQPGFNWYFARPFKYPPSPANSVSVADGVLTIDTDGHSNMGMLSIRKAGAGWDGFAVTGGAYFEASIAFDPDVQSIHPRGWPSFWTMGAGHLYGTESPFVEVDFFEYDTPSAGKDTYGAAIHDWIMAPTATKRNSNKSSFVARAPGVDWTKFNTVGGLVKPDEGIDFYFNNALILTNPYSKYPWMGYADTEQLPVILGSDGWPMKVDWVRVWTR